MTTARSLNVNPALLISKNPNLKQPGSSVKEVNKVAKHLTPLLQKNEILRNRYKVAYMIGGGGFGQVFRAFDKTKREYVAIKICSKSSDPRRMKIEHMILIMLRGKEHIPEMIGSGTVRGCPYIVMQLVGRNLSELKKKEKHKHLTVSTVYRVSIQVIIALQYLHEEGFIHRDIKPANICIGRYRSDRKNIYLLDFGMARIFIEGNGTFRRPRKHVGFRGTLRYASPSVHARKETGPCDDFVSWLYSIVELVDGRLPWSSTSDHKAVEKYKKSTNLEELCKNNPPSLLEFARYVTSLNCDEMPDYEKIRRLMNEGIPKGTKINELFDWELRKSVSQCARQEDKTTRTQSTSVALSENWENQLCKTVKSHGDITPHTTQ